MAAIIQMRGAKEAPRRYRSKMDTICVTPAWVTSLETPPFQRPLRINEKVRGVAESIKEDGVIPGTIVIGRFQGKNYRLDGQHRLEAFIMSGVAEALADVRIVEFDSMADMGVEFVELNSHLANMRPDDNLRAVEASNPALCRLRQVVPFIGYDQIRRNDRSPILSMSMTLRCWRASSMETPSSPAISALDLASEIDEVDAERLSVFLLMCDKAWGRDQEYTRLWGALNISLCMWLWRQSVLGDGLGPSRRITKISKEHFLKAMMGLSADATYVEWLVGRKMGDKDRSPAYHRIRRIVAPRIEAETKQKIMLPSPPWYTAGGGGIRKD